MGISTLSALAVDMGLSYDNKAKIAFGNFNNFYMSAIVNAEERCILISTSAKESSTAPYQPFEEFVVELQNKLKNELKANCAITRNGNRFLFTLTLKNRTTKTMSAVRIIIESISAYLNQNQFISACEKCGVEFGNSLYNVNHATHYFCENCYNETVNMLEENKQQIKRKKGNIITGIVGALLGSLLGVLVWVLISQLGYISALGGLAIAVCAFKGYEMLGGKLNVVGVIVSCLVVVFMVYFATSLSLSLDLYNELKIEYEISFFDCYKAIPAFLGESSEILGYFLYDLIIGYVLSLIAIVPAVKNMLTNKAGIYKVGKIGE